MSISVVQVLVVNNRAVAVVQASCPPTAEIRMELHFCLHGSEDPWEAAYENALRYLDVA